MLLIECPFCGKRDETEFSYAGEAHIARPLETEQLSDAEWADSCSCVKTRKVCTASNGYTQPDVGVISMPSAIP